MRAHYFYGGDAASRAPAPRVIDVAAHPSIEDLSIASDVLVTDYSSLMFDYAVLDRPIVIYAPDWDDLPDRARHVLRPAGRAARRRRDHPGRADRRPALRSGRGRRQCRAPA